MSFPRELDNARVLYYTPPACYGTVSFATGKIVDIVCYLAICKYEKDVSFYLFGCNKDYEVVSDSLWESIEECMRMAETSCNNAISWVVMT